MLKLEHPTKVGYSGEAHYFVYRDARHIVPHVQFLYSHRRNNYLLMIMIVRILLLVKLAGPYKIYTKPCM